MRKTQLRFDFQTLWVFCHRRSGLPIHQASGGNGGKARYKTKGSGKGLSDWRPRDKTGDRGFSMSYMADMIGVDSTTILKWQKQGYVPFDSAERAACALGLTTMNIWPGEYEKWVPDKAEIRQADSSKRQRQKKSVAA